MTNTRVRINGRLNIAEEKISKLKDIAVEIINKTGGERMNWVSVTSGTAWSILMYMFLEIRRGRDRKVFKELMARIFSDSINTKPIDPGSWTNAKPKKHENYTKVHHKNRMHGRFNLWTIVRQPLFENTI